MLGMGTALGAWAVKALLRGGTTPAVAAAALTALLVPTFFAYLPNVFVLGLAAPVLVRGRRAAAI